MVAFNQDPQVSDSPSFLHYSRGEKHIDYASIFGDLDNVIKGGAQAVDLGNIHNIDQQIQKSYDGANDEFGIGAAANMQADPNNPIQPTPVEINRAGDDLKSLNTAFQAGVVKPSYYHARLESVVRSLRAQYPGYRDVIDQRVSSITGETPANSLRASLEEESRQTSAQGQRAQTQLLEARKSAAENGIVPDPNDTADQIWAKTYPAMAQKAKIAGQEAQLKADAALGQTKETQAIQVAQSKIDNMGDLVLGGVIGTATNGAQGEKLADMVKTFQSDGVISKDEQEQLMAGYQQLQAQYKQKVQEVMSDPMYSSITPQNREALLKSANSRLDAVGQMIESKQWGALVWNQQVSDGIAKGDLAKVLSRSDLMRAVQVLNTIGGQQAAAEFLTSNPNKLDEYHKLISSVTAMQTITGEKTLDDGIKSIIQNAKDPKSAGPAVDQYIKLTLSNLKSATDPEAIKAAAGGLYKAGATPLAYMTPQSAQQTFQKMTTADITKKVMATGDTDTINGYSKFAKDGFMKVFADQIGDIKQAIDSKTFKLTYDEATGMFRGEDLKVTQDASLAPYSTVGGVNMTTDPLQVSVSNTDAKRAVDNLNQNVINMNPIMKATGDDLSQIPAMLQKLGVQADFAKGNSNVKDDTPNRDRQKTGTDDVTGSIDVTPKALAMMDEADKAELNDLVQTGGKMTRGIRNNNPGNIEAHGGPNDGRFAVYQSPETGLKAMGSLLTRYQTKYNRNTINEIIHRWAPPKENDTAAYVARVSKIAGIGADDPVDLKDTGVLAKIMQGMITVENGHNPYPEQLIEASLQ